MPPFKNLESSLENALFGLRKATIAIEQFRLMKHYFNYLSTTIFLTMIGKIVDPFSRQWRSRFWNSLMYCLAERSAPVHQAVLKRDPSQPNAGHRLFMGFLVYS
jgi:hypothetical protein